MRISSFSATANASTKMTNNQDEKIQQLPEETAAAESIDEVSIEKLKDVENDKVINDQMLENSVKQANKNLAQYNRMILRTVHEKTHTVMYTLKDTITNEVIREFPPRKIQDMIAKMWEMAGIMVDERR